MTWTYSSPSQTVPKSEMSPKAQVNDFCLVIRLLLSLLFRFFPQLSFERVSYLESSLLPKPLTGRLESHFPLCPTVLLHFLLLLQSELPLKHNTGRDILQNGGQSLKCKSKPLFMLAVLTDSFLLRQPH